MTCVAHSFAEGRNRIRIRDVFLLSHCRHGQVLLDQPDDQVGILFLQAMRFAEGLSIGHAQFGVVAPSAFGNVVEEGGKNE